MAKSKFKPLSFTTTLRNPERIGYFLKSLAIYEGQILTNEIINAIVFDVIRNKLYCPKWVNNVKVLKDIYYSDTGVFTDKQLHEIVTNSPQQHKEAGFDKGWPSRFDTWYKITMEFGFAKYAIGAPIEVSETGHMLIDAISTDVVDDEKIQNVFLNAMVKYQVNNPYRKVLNNNVPMVLLLQVIDMFRKNEENFSGISRHELSLFICWPNNDASALYEKIKSFRENVGVSKYTDEFIYNECLRLLGYGEEGKRYIKISKVVGEAVDEYIRKMRITGIISLRGNGRFLDWNTLKQRKIDYILKEYARHEIFNDPDEFYSYMSSTDPVLMEREQKEDEGKLLDIKQAALEKYALDYGREKIFEELKIVSVRKESKDELLKFIPAPARYEFLISICLVQNFPDAVVRPNYPIDDEGIPTSTAAGGLGDIECEDELKELIEVTLIQGRNQVTIEMLPISRHLSDLSMTTDKKCVAIFIAPTIHPDAVRYTKWIKDDEGLTIIPYNTEELIDSIKVTKKLSELVQK